MGVWVGSKAGLIGLAGSKESAVRSPVKHAMSSPLDLLTVEPDISVNSKLIGMSAGNLSHLSILGNQMNIVRFCCWIKDFDYSDCFQPK